MTETIQPGPETERAFRNALGCFGTGVTVVTCATPDGPLAITANSFASVSMEPPLVLWSPAKSSSRYAAFVEARHSAIHIIDRDDLDLARTFATDGTDFSHCDWSEDAEGRPILSRALSRFDCTAHASHDGGDHTILVARVTGFVAKTGTPLLFAQGRYGQLQDLT